MANKEQKRSSREAKKPKQKKRNRQAPGRQGAGGKALKARWVDRAYPGSPEFDEALPRALAWRTTARANGTDGASHGRRAK